MVDKQLYKAFHLPDPTTTTYKWIQSAVFIPEAFQYVKTWREALGMIYEDR